MDILELNGRLYLDGQLLEDSFNVIFKERIILVPLRKTFESIGFIMNWNTDTDMHELLSSEHQFMFKVIKGSSLPYHCYPFKQLPYKVYSLAYGLFFQSKEESENNNIINGWVPFEIKVSEEYSFFEIKDGETASLKLGRFNLPLAEACLVDDRFYMPYNDMNALLRQVGYMLEVDTDIRSVFIHSTPNTWSVTEPKGT